MLLAEAEVNEMELQVRLDTMTESRDSMIIALDEAGEFAEEIMAVIDSMNETMVALYDALAENATLAQQWQIEAQSARRTCVMLGWLIRPYMAQIYMARI